MTMGIGYFVGGLVLLCRDYRLLPGLCECIRELKL